MSSRKRTSDQEPSSETSTAVAEPPASEASAGADAPTPETSGNGKSFAERVGQRKKIADPFGIAGDYQAGIRLFESREDRQMALKFEEKPSQAVIDKLKEAGYRWQPANGVWAH